ncbi:hypothetical protein R5R35_005676 [Gryllus longicercus]|uniref:Peroxisomal membrane protein PEX13 n=1 Tax=Gryllus longicercus TaxID=2509291 RepID=A0AAN9VL33_9ORTH
MLPPQKPWETGPVNQRALHPISNSDGLQSSASNVGSYPPGTTFVRANQRNPPPPPPRPSRQPYQNGFGAGYGTSSYFSSPFSSYGGYGSGLNNYGYNSFGNYGNYGNYSSFGGYGINRMGFPHSLPESRFIRMAEDGSRPAFQSIESLVQAFGSVSFMLESTFNAMYSSFRAVLGVAENFGRLRAMFGQFLSVFAVFRWLQWLYKKCLYLLGLRPDDPGREQLWRQASQAVAGGSVDSESKRTSWPVMVFLGIILSGPYLMWKLLSSIDIPNIDPYNPRDWSKCKEAGHSAVALYDFVAASSQELSLRAGQKVLIAPKDCQQNQSWLLASVDGVKVGLVPSNYIRSLGRVVFQAQKPTQSDKTPVPANEVPDIATNSVADVAGIPEGAVEEVVPEPSSNAGPFSSEPSNNGEDSV